MSILENTARLLEMNFRILSQQDWSWFVSSCVIFIFSDRLLGADYFMIHTIDDNSDL